MFLRKRLALFAPVLLFGCAHGFDRNALQERLNDGSLQISDSSIAAARSLKPQLKFPCRIAVHFQSASGDWHWTPDDKATLKTWSEALIQDGVASDVFLLPEMLAGKGDVKELRLAAAKCGADVLFAIRGAVQTDSYKNFAAAFNLTILGGYVVPGSHRDSLFLLEGVLIDVDNGYIYTAVQTEGIGKIMRPTFVIEDKDAIALAKTKAMAEFGSEVLQRMRGLAAKSQPGR